MASAHEKRIALSARPELSGRDSRKAPPQKPTVVIGLLGSTLDAGFTEARWQRWRPTVALGMHESLRLHRLELLYQPSHEKLAQLILEDMAVVSPETTVKLVPIPVKDPWDLEEMYGCLHDFTCAYPFNTDQEDYLIHITTGTHVAQICLYLLTESRYLPGRLLQSGPPKEPREKAAVSPPILGEYRVIDLDLSRYDRIAARFAREQAEGLSALKSGINTRNRHFNHLIEQLERVAVASKAPILLLGPTGAGKSQLARQVYEVKKNRRQVEGPFVEVNCATLRGDGAMSALFGHVKGAFTGALSDRPGLLRRADNGLLFLDEIGELGLDEQAMLLRALEEKRFLPVGSDREVRSDFQLIAGTNRDLFARAQAGEFREDLLARLNLWTFELPGLKARPEDMEPNLDYELGRYAREQGQHVTFSKEARQQFLDFAQAPASTWRGNFRDFNAALTRMATLSHGGRITQGEVSDEIGRLNRSWHGHPTKVSTPANPADEALRQVMSNEQLDKLDLFDRVQLAEVVRVCMNSRSLSEAGRVLFAASRRQKASSNDADRLRKYLARFELDFAQLQPAQFKGSQGEKGEGQEA